MKCRLITKKTKYFYVFSDDNVEEKRTGLITSAFGFYSKENKKLNKKKCITLSI